MKQSQTSCRRAQTDAVAAAAARRRGLRSRVSWFASSLVLLGAAAAFAPAALAQNTGTIQGRVQNVATGAYLENARVSLAGTSNVTFTDESGFYRLTNVPAGEATVRVFYTGLDTTEQTVTVPAGQTARQNFSLTSAVRYGPTTQQEGEIVRLDEFVVQSNRETDAASIAVQEQRFAGNITSVVSTDEFGAIVDRNPGEFLKFLPGVDVEYFANNIVGVSVRGLGSVNTEVNFDGLPIASMNAEGVGRGFEMKGGSAADIARVEVRKLPLPEDSANALGGSINLVRRSAFEYSKRRIDYSLLFSSDAESITLADRDGPKDRERSRWRPNWEMKWTEPLSENLGFAVTVGHNENIVMTHWSLPGWNYGSRSNNEAAEAAIAAGQPVPEVPSIYNPAMRNPLLHDAPIMQSRDYASGRVDWRPFPDLTLGYSVSWTRFQNQTADDIRVRWDTAATGSGAVAQQNNEHMTIGRLNGGGFRHDNPLWRDINAPTLSNVLEARWRSGPWTVSAKGVVSESKYQYYDTEHGFFNSSSVSNVSGLPNIGHVGVGASSARPIPITLTFAEHDYYGPKTITAVDASGNAIDWADLDEQYIGGARSRPGKSKEIITAFKTFVKRDFAFENPFSVQLGVDYQERYRNRRYDSKAWRFVGADGIPSTPDDVASQIAADFLPAHRDTVYGHPPIERISMSKLYDLYLANPSWFEFDAQRTFVLTASQNAAYELTEETFAPYLQMEWRLLDNRLRLIGGVRYEKTEAEAVGLLDDISRSYQKNSDGSVVRDVDGDPVLLPGIAPNSFEQAILRYTPKGATGTGENDNYFPSLHATYNLTDNLVLQLGYAETQAKNRFDRSVIPNDTIDSNPRDSGALGRISVRNTKLRPWKGDNFEGRLSYYNNTGGLIGVGLYRKIISDWQESITTDPLTAEQIAEFGYGPEYAGYEVNTIINQGSAKIDGAELEFRQSLDPYLPDWARGFLVRGSVSYGNMSGQDPGGDFGNFRTWRDTLSFSFRRGKFAANVGYTMNGKQLNNGNRSTNGFQGERYYLRQHLVDVNFEYSVTKWARLFVSGRNITDELRIRHEDYGVNPEWSKMNSSNSLGHQITVGVTGSF